MRKQEFLSLEELEAYDDELCCGAELFPKKGDKLFIETEDAVRLDPLGYSGTSQLQCRSMVGEGVFTSKASLRQVTDW